jgi:BASS family bile acid:Na+ symporter
MTPSLARDAGVAALVVLVMFGVGAGLGSGTLAAAFRRPWSLGRALVAEHVAMPLVALAIAHALGLPAAGLAALVLCAATPGGPIAPMFAMQARADVAFSVALVLASALVNVVATPATLRLLAPLPGAGGAPVSVFVPLMRTIALYQLLPLGVGMALRRTAPTAASRVARGAEVGSKLVIAALVIGMTATQWRLLLALPPAVFAGLVALCVSGAALGYLVVGRDPGLRGATAVNASVRNMGLGLLVATQLYGDGSPDGELTILAVMVFGLVMMIIATAVARAVRVHAPLLSAPTSPST